MGDRISVTVTDGTRTSPTLYCHWAGLRALKVVHDAAAEPYNDIHNLMCNIVVKAMCGECNGASFYLYNTGECFGASEWDNYDWTFNCRTKMWTTDYPGFKDTELTMQQVEDFVRKERPCLYRKCPCEDYNDPKKHCLKRFNDSLYKCREGSE